MLPAVSEALLVLSKKKINQERRLGGDGIARVGNEGYLPATWIAFESILARTSAFSLFVC